MITTILRAPTGAGISQYALKLAYEFASLRKYQGPIPMIVQMRELDQQWKLVAERLGIEIVTYRPTEWVRKCAGNGRGLVLVSEIHDSHLRRIIATLEQDEHEFWLINPPLSVDIRLSPRHETPAVPDLIGFVGGRMIAVDVAAPTANQELLPCQQIPK